MVHYRSGRGHLPSCNKHLVDLGRGIWGDRGTQAGGEIGP